MKHKNTPLLLSVAILFAQTATAQLPAWLPSIGLVAWYPFNNNANDESSNAHNLTVNGASPANDRFGALNSAYSFNGSGNYLTGGSSPDFAIAEDRTLSVWINRGATLTTDQGIVGYVGSSGSLSGHTGYFMNIHPPFGYAQAFEDSATLDNNLNYAGVTSNDPCSAGQWHHLVQIRSNGTTHLYMDGVMQNGSVSITPYFLNASLLVGFNGVGANDQYFNGSIDDIGIWNRALTDVEIAAVYNAGTTASIPSWLPTQCLVAWYPFNGNANDESGHGNNGIVNGATLTTDHLGIANSAYYFNGMGNNIDIGNDPSLGRASTSFSVVAWVNLDVFDNNRSCIISNRDGSSSIPGTCIGIAGTNDPGPGFDDGELNITAADPVQFSANQALPLSTWKHVVMSYDHAAGIVKAYYDGAFIDQGSMANFSENLTQNHLIGFEAANGGIYPFNGSIDDVALYNCVLSDAEILGIFEGSMSTSLNEMSSQGLSMSVYPNPTSGSITIEGITADLRITPVRIIDAQGRQIPIAPAKIIGTGHVALDLTGLPSGLYMLRIGEHVQRIIKQD